jgi:C-terminal processing protease CtpA/Prc
MKKLIIIFVTFVILACMLGCEDIFVDEPEGHPEAIFENIWTTFYEEYAPFEERGVDWLAAYETYRPQVNANTSDDELYAVVTDMLKTLNDGHVSLTAPDREVFHSNKVRRERTDDQLFSISLVKNYLAPGFTEGEEQSYLYGKINDEDLGYIFFDYVGDNLLKLNDFLAKYGEMDGFIIDLRHNKGGDFTFGFSEIGRLTDQIRYVFRSKTKNGPQPNDYTEWHEWYIHPKGSYLDQPIVVLTDRYTISAGERLVMGLETLPNTTVMGDTTNGAHGTLVGRELANGWFYSLVPQKVEMYDGKSYEGIGLAPDILVKNSLTEVEGGIDRTLQTAIDRLK